VDNIVDKPACTPRQPCIHAVFNKLPVLNAKIKPNQINDLAQMRNFPTSTDEVLSYKILQQGISRKKFAAPA
jgi:hypothetical protein